MFRCFCCALTLALAFVLVAPRAAARRGRARSAATDERAKARKHFRKGRWLFHKRRYQQAVWAFERAYQHWKHHSILFNLALAHALLGQRVQAGAYLRKYLKAPGSRRKRLPRVLQKLKRELGALVIKVADPEAAIFVDGRRVGYGSVEVVVLPGRRVVEIRKGDWVAKRMELVVEPGAEKSWELSEMPRRRRPRPRPVPLPRPRPTPLGRLHWAYVTAAASVTVALLGAAVGMSVKNQQTYEEFDARRWDVTLADRGKQQQLVANVMWGLTAAAAAATAVLGVFTRWRGGREAAGGVTVQPSLGPGGASVRVQW